MSNTASSLDLSPEVSEVVRSVATRFTEGQRHDRTESFDEPLWHDLDELGLTRIGIDEDKGGSGGTFRDALAAAIELAAGGCAVPYVETVIASWLLAEADIETPEGSLALAVDGSFEAIGDNEAGYILRGTQRNLGWARVASYIAGIAQTPRGPAIFLVESSAADITPGTTLATEPVDTVTLDAPPAAISVLPPESALHSAAPARLAIARSAQITGAARRSLELAVEHARSREQFGRPIGKFQAVQHHLAVIAEECELAAVATGTAIEALENNASPQFAAAVAKIIAGEAATAVAARTHQVHGAIGLTVEYELQRLTRRMWSWRDDAGSEADWSRIAGDIVREHGHSGLWALLTSIDQAA